MARRHFTDLVTPRRLATAVIVTILALVLARPAAAQNGACPPNSYLIGDPAGWVPNGMDGCSYTPAFVSLRDDPDNERPCDQWVFLGNYLDALGHRARLVIVPPADQYYGQQVRVRYMIMTAITTAWPQDDRGYDDFDVHTSYFDRDGILYNTRIGNLGSEDDFIRIDTWYDGTLTRRYYTVWLADYTLNTPDSDAGSGGYLQVTIRWPDSLSNNDFGITSVQVAGPYDVLPTHCEIPNANLPTDPPPPTPTIPATWTPHATPTPLTTPAATSPGTTPIPTWTPTPIIYPTLPSEATATRYPVPQLQPLTWPTLDLPTAPTIEIPAPVEVTVDSSVTVEERSTRTYEMAGDVVDIATRWADQVNWAAGSIDPDNNAGARITGTLPISSTTGAIGSTIEYIAYPFRFVRSLKTYMPNAWRGIFPFFLVLIVVFGTHVSKFAVSIISEVIDVVRRLWDALPLT
jgi:hypothetical protein